MTCLIAHEPQRRQNRALDMVRHQGRSCEGRVMMSLSGTNRTQLIEKHRNKRRTSPPKPPYSNAVTIRSNRNPARTEPKYP